MARRRFSIPNPTVHDTVSLDFETANTRHFYRQAEETAEETEQEVSSVDAATEAEAQFLRRVADTLSQELDTLGFLLEGKLLQLLTLYLPPDAPLATIVPEIQNFVALLLEDHVRPIVKPGVEMRVSTAIMAERVMKSMLGGHVFDLPLIPDLGTPLGVPLVVDSVEGNRWGKK